MTLPSSYRSEIRLLKRRKAIIKSTLWIIRYCDEGRMPYAVLCYKDVRKRRMKEIELRDELRKLEDSLMKFII